MHSSSRLSEDLLLRLASHPTWLPIADGSQLERVIRLEELCEPAPGRETAVSRRLRLQAAGLAHRVLRMEVPLSCTFDGDRVVLRVPATDLGVGFIERCDLELDTKNPEEYA